MNNLFIVGAQRSGTTYLYNLLDAHPQVYMAKPVWPEPKFFINEELFKKGREFYEKQYFPQKKEGILFLGEKSTSYLEIDISPGNIQKYYPDAYIIIILRNPILRAWSNYKFSLQNGFENLPFSVAIEEEKNRLNDSSHISSVHPFAYQRRGHYILYIEKYLKIFDREKINILVLEELVGNKVEIEKLYTWLGINNDFLPDYLNERVNSSFSQDYYPIDTFKKMIPKYMDSVEALETFLGRRINVWRDHWSTL